MFVEPDHPQRFGRIDDGLLDHLPILGRGVGFVGAVEGEGGRAVGDSGEDGDETEGGPEVSLAGNRGGVGVGGGEQELVVLDLDGPGLGHWMCSFEGYEPLT